MTELLERLERVKPTGRDSWIARCPAHDDRTPSLAIREASDGRILVHCFAGCETEDVLAALELTFGDVMPERIGPKHRYKPFKRRFDARHVLECLSHETMVVCLIAERIAELADGPEKDRLILAASRFSTALRSCPETTIPMELKAIRRRTE